MEPDLLVPENLTAEQAVLGMALANVECARLMAAQLSTGDFYREIHQHIAAAIIAILERGDVPSIPTVLGELDRRRQAEDCGGIDYLQALVSQWADGALPSIMRSDIREVRDNALRRRLMEIATRAYTAAPRADSIGALAAETAADLIEIASRAQAAGPSADELANWLWGEVQRDAEVVGPRLGVQQFDRMVGGFGRQRLVVVQGPTKFGKSTFVEQVAWQTTVDGLPMLFFVLEGSVRQRFRRWVSWRAQVRHDLLEPGGEQPSEAERERIAAAIAEWQRLPLVVHDRIYDIAQIEAEARQQADKWANRQRPLAGIVIDYAQNVTGGRGRTETAQYRDIAARLQALADELAVPILVPSQVTVSMDGEVYTYGARAWQHNATLVIGLVRGERGMPAEERRRSPVLHVACIAARDIEPFAPIELRLAGWCHRIMAIEEYQALQSIDAEEAMPDELVPDA